MEGSLIYSLRIKTIFVSDEYYACDFLLAGFSYVSFDILQSLGCLRKNTIKGYY